MKLTDTLSISFANQINNHLTILQIYINKLLSQ